MKILTQVRVAALVYNQASTSSPTSSQG